MTDPERSRPVLGRKLCQSDSLTKRTCYSKTPTANGKAAIIPMDTNGNTDDVFHNDKPPVDMIQFYLDRSEFLYEGNVGCNQNEDFKKARSASVTSFSQSTIDYLSDQEEDAVKSSGVWSQEDPVGTPLPSVSPYCSTGFYKNLKSDYDCFEPVSPDLARPNPSFGFDFGVSGNDVSVVQKTIGIQYPDSLHGSHVDHCDVNGNVEQTTFEMLQKLTFNVENNVKYTNRKTLDAAKYCAFCKRNGETREFFSTHIVKDSRGRVICPILRKYVCPTCQATGDQAHTRRHCPFKLRTALQLAC